MPNKITMINAVWMVMMTGMLAATVALYDQKVDASKVYGPLCVGPRGRYEPILRDVKAKSWRIAYVHDLDCAYRPYQHHVYRICGVDRNRSAARKRRRQEIAGQA
jgi:hypothetical protein